MSRKIKVCKKGSSCGYSCISESKTCRKNLPSDLTNPLDIRAGALDSSSQKVFVDPAKEIYEDNLPLPRGKELVEVTREWSDDVGITYSRDEDSSVVNKSLVYHDDQHTLLHAVLGMTTREINGKGENKVSWREEVMVELLQWEVSQRSMAKLFGDEVTDEQRRERIQFTLRNFLEGSKRNGWTKSAKVLEGMLNDPDGKEFNEILSLWGRIKPERWDELEGIMMDIRKPEYNDYSEISIDEQNRLGTELWMRRWQDAGEEIPGL